MSTSQDNYLFAVYLGGDPAPGGMIEAHEVVFVVASDVRAARHAAKLKWRHPSRPHVDSIATLEVVDGFAVTLVPSGESDRVDVDVTYEP
jgi:hypothetical protein